MLFYLNPGFSSGTTQLGKDITRLAINNISELSNNSYVREVNNIISESGLGLTVQVEIDHRWKLSTLNPLHMVDDMIVLSDTVLIDEDFYIKKIRSLRVYCLAINKVPVNFGRNNITDLTLSGSFEINWQNLNLKVLERVWLENNNVLDNVSADFKSLRELSIFNCSILSKISLGESTGKLSKLTIRQVNFDEKTYSSLKDYVNLRSLTVEEIKLNYLNLEGWLPFLLNLQEVYLILTNLNISKDTLSAFKRFRDIATFNIELKSSKDIDRVYEYIDDVLI
jgi:hypothetical protein